eukprot:GHVU01230317.1.p1 GENE.GHVU01230317.1~~GHVU01230317.1.p1  ORF type:complete len:375 (-),score=40.54 GHVU01230317.1:1259-2356(-)
MSHDTGFRISSDVTTRGDEVANFPILCETCLGDNPYVRMSKEVAGKECKICTRPFTVFRWQPGRKARHKSTIVCQMCSKLKNVCQTCLFDLEFGLPVQVRDKFLEDSQKLELPDSRVNRDFATAKYEQDHQGETYGKMTSHPLLMKLARHAPYYKRNRARVCTFWLRGECTRGDSCPYRHEEEDGDPELENQNIKDRYIGREDPVANKIMRKADEVHTLKPPEDTSITTLYVGALPPDVTEANVRDQFYPFGEIRSIKMIPRQSCAFVTYVTREAAEAAAAKLHKLLTFNGSNARLLWGRPSSGPPGQSAVAGNAILPNGMPAMYAGVGGARGMPSSSSSSSSKPYYPSMDPAAMGNARLDARGE